MTTNVDLAGNTLIVEDIRVGATKSGQQGTPVAGLVPGDQTITGKKAFTDGINSKQSVEDVDASAPTVEELTAAFGDPADLGRGFIGTVDDNDGDTNGFLVWTSDASFYYIKGTKAVPAN